MLSFDLYGTLVDWRYVIDGFIARVVGSSKAVDEFFKCEFQAIRVYKPYSTILSECLRQVCGLFNIDYLEIYGDSLVRMFSKSPPFPDTIIGLSLLKERGYRLMIISNTERRLIDVTLNGFRDLFDWVVTAEDLRIYKPDPEAFRRAYRAVGLENRLDKVIHVSAYPEYDLEPASSIGVKTVLIDRYGGSWSLSFKDLIEFSRKIHEIAI